MKERKFSTSELSTEQIGHLVRDSSGYATEVSKVLIKAFGPMSGMGVKLAVGLLTFSLTVLKLTGFKQGTVMHIVRTLYERMYVVDTTNEQKN